MFFEKNFQIKQTDDVMTRIIVDSIVRIDEKSDGCIIHYSTPKGDLHTISTIWTYAQVYESYQKGLEDILKAAKEFQEKHKTMIQNPKNPGQRW